MKRASHLSPAAPQPMRQPMDDDGMKAGIQGNHFKGRARRRIAVEYDGNIFLELAEKAHTFVRMLFPSNLVNYSAP